MPGELSWARVTLPFLISISSVYREKSGDSQEAPSDAEGCSRPGPGSVSPCSQLIDSTFLQDWGSGKLNISKGHLQPLLLKLPNSNLLYISNFIWYLIFKCVLKWLPKPIFQWMNFEINHLNFVGFETLGGECAWGGLGGLTTWQVNAMYRMYRAILRTGPPLTFRHLL